jgi:hypothetical protein
MASQKPFCHFSTKCPCRRPLHRRSYAFRAERREEREKNPKSVTHLTSSDTGGSQCDRGQIFL